MFYKHGIILRSSALDGGSVAHGFSTRLGGVSVHPFTREMNLAFGREDPDGVVLENVGIFARAVTDGALGAPDAVFAPQIHSDRVKYATAADRGDGVLRRDPDAEGLDGFVTDEPGVLVGVRVADCVPILMRGERDDGSPAVAAVHAGWRGTVSGIAARAVEKLAALGVPRKSVRAAIGPHIGVCCFEVKEDFRDAVTAARGGDFARRFVASRNGSLCADLTGMNLYILAEAGVARERVDVSPDCTACDTATYHSHRKTGGRRGAMGAAVAILKGDKAE